MKSQDREKSPLPLEDMSIPALLRRRFKSFVQSVTSVSSSPAIREIVGTLSCMTVITYVSGYAFGAWFHKTKKQLTKNNDQND